MHSNNKCEYKELIRIFSGISSGDKMESLFSEMFTEGEINDFIMRWILFKDLKSGKTQREIAKLRKLSLCKITRGSKILKNKESIIYQLLENGVLDERTT